MIETNTSHEISLKELILRIQDWFKFLFSKWYIFLIAIIFGYGIGYYYESRKPIKYTASTSFILEGEGSGQSSLPALGALLGSDFLDRGSNSLFQGQSLIELYKSRAILKEVLLSPMDDDSSTLIIQKLFLINEKLKEKVSEPNKILLSKKDFLLNPQIENLRTRDSIIQGAIKTINGGYFSVDYPNSRASIIQVDVHAEDEIFAKTFNHYLVSKVNDLYMEIKAGKSYENVKVLQKKVDSVRHIMVSSLSRVAVSQDQTPNLNPTKVAIRAIPTQSAQMTIEATKGVYAEFNKNLEMAKLGLSKDAPLIKVIDEATYPLTKNIPDKNKKGIIFSLGLFFLSIIFMSLLYIYRLLMKEV
nr:lipopolysaccharide biosynthesis protein [uncultured Sphingobacterium sp.]